MEYLGNIRFGTLYQNGTAKLLRPTRPWFSNNYPGSLSERGKGNISTSASGVSFHIDNTDPDTDYQIQWVHFKEGNLHIYVCDRVLLTNISWNDLNEKGMITGTPVTIDGKEYKLRVLTGGMLASAGTEWDKFIQNPSISSLPKPTTEDINDTNTYGQLDGAHNQLWNWWGVRTICQETEYSRGYTSASGRSSLGVTDKTLAMGWRPVLEHLDTTPPPEKPYIVTPTGTETKPSVTDTKPLVIETVFNNPGSTFKSMEYVIVDLDLNKVLNTVTVFKPKDTVSLSGEVGHRYQLKVTHTNINNQTSPEAISYFMWGKLNKYKLSEPITVKQYDKVKTYTGGENLKMKPQTFPETESSVVRLVPQTMNTLTAGETNTNELEFTATTKTPVIGDRLIKDKEVYTISDIEEPSQMIHVDQNLKLYDDIDSKRLTWTFGTTDKTYVYQDNIYVLYKGGDYVYLTKTPINGGHSQDIFERTVTGTEFTSLALTGYNQMLYVIMAYSSKLTVNVVDLSKTPLVFNETTLPFTKSISTISSTIDKLRNELVVATREYVSVGGQMQISLKAYWFNIKDPTKVSIEVEHYMVRDATYESVGHPVIAEVGDLREGNICVYYPEQDGSGVAIREASFKGRQMKIITITINSNAGNAVLSRVNARAFIGASDQPSLGIIAYFKGADGKYHLGTWIYTKSSWNKHEVHVSDTKYSDYTMVYTKNNGYILLYGYGDNIIKASKQNPSEAWGDTKQILSNLSTDTSQILDTINYEASEYGTYPGIIYMHYDAVKRTNRLVLRSDYIPSKLTNNILILDKSITTSAGETIKFLDYDLEVKSKDSIATITPTTITNSYYEYDAKFDKKEAERKVTVVGRNSKLTTLYYYNY